MRPFLVLVTAGILTAAQAFAQDKLPLSVQSAEVSQHKSIQLERAFSAFRTGALHGGLLILADLMQRDKSDIDIQTLYRLNAGRLALKIAEQCNLESVYANCDTAIRYVAQARRLGDSSVFHEVLAQALVQKIAHLEEVDFNKYRELMPPRMLTRDMAYRYLPEERKIIFRDLLKEAIEHVTIARGELERKEKLIDLTNKLRVVERYQKMVGNR